MANKEQALDLFRSREALLSKIVGPALNMDAFKRFLPRLHRMPGNCLCMNPGEVAQGDEEDFLPLKHILELIADSTTPLDVLQEALRQFSQVNYAEEDDVVVNIVGYTY